MPRPKGSKNKVKSTTAQPDFTSLIAEKAAERIFQLFDNIKRNEKILSPVESGVCSTAHLMRTRWYRSEII